MLLLFTLTPKQPHPYSLTVLCIFELVTGVQHYLFRSYLDSGPPALHTINNSILKSFSYCIQWYSTYIWMFSTGFYVLGQEYTYGLAEKYPKLMCAVLTPKFLALWFIMCIFFMALVNLGQVFWTTGYLEMNHELVFKGVLALELAMEVCAYSIDYLFLQSFCIPSMAAKSLEMMIGRNESRDEVEFSNIPTGTYTVNPMFSAFIIFVYLTSVTLKKCKVIRDNKKKGCKMHQKQPLDNLAYCPDQSPLVAANQMNALDCAFLVPDEAGAPDQNLENIAKQSEHPNQGLVSTNEKTKSLSEVVATSKETKTYKVIISPADETKATIVKVIKVKPVDNTGEGNKVSSTEQFIYPDFSNASSIEDDSKLETLNNPAGVPNTNLNLTEVTIPNHYIAPKPINTKVSSLAKDSLYTSRLEFLLKI